MSGSYRGFSDGWPNGVMINYKQGGDARRWKLDPRHMTRRLSETEVLAQQRAAGARRRQQDRDIAARQKSAAQRARSLWNEARPATHRHPYLRAKKIGGQNSHGENSLREDSRGEGRQGRLLVPLFNAKGELRNLQIIAPDGSKRFLRGGQKQGCFHITGDPDKTNILLIAEGYATAASLHQAKGLPVAVAFDAGNLKPVAMALREHHPDATLIIAADDDHKGHHNTGLTKGAAAAQAVGGLMIRPDFTPAEKRQGLTDFNDLANARGTAAVRALLERAVSRATALVTDTRVITGVTDSHRSFETSESPPFSHKATDRSVADLSGTDTSAISTPSVPDKTINHEKEFTV